MHLSTFANLFNQNLIQALKSINTLLANDSLSVTPALVRQTFPNLLIERLYYAEGRQHPSHPLHGSHAGLCRS
ncbi:cyanate hydratase [Synechococcus sp. ROS8604]|nr:cyanate hydratase [Synechococcus sp. ROS8604]